MTHHTAPTVTAVAQPSRDNNKYATNPNLIPFLMSQHYAMQNNDFLSNQQQQQQQLLLHHQQQQQQQQKRQYYQEQQKSYVSALVNVTVQIITSIWPNSNSTPSSCTRLSSPPTSPAAGRQVQNKSTRPVANLSTFLHHILKHSRTTHSTLQLAIFYLFRIRTVVQERKGQDVYISCGRRMFLAALITAHKFLQDKTYKNTAWSKVSGLGVHEITHAEKIMLQLLDYRLYVKKDTYDQWIYMLQSHIKVPSLKIQLDQFNPSQQQSTAAAQEKLHRIAQQSLPSPPAEHHSSPQKRKNSFLDDELELIRKKR